MAQAKYTLYKYVKRCDGRWRYCRAALCKNHTIKPNTAIVGGKEAHAEGDYYIAHDSRPINVGPDALEAQRQQHRLPAGGTTVRVPESDTGKYKLVTILSAQPLDEAGGQEVEGAQKFLQMRFVTVWSMPPISPASAVCCDRKIF
jgi:hypothetical protein